MTQRGRRIFDAQTTAHLKRRIRVNRTPVEIVETLNSEINAVLADPDIRKRFADLGATVLPGTSADFGKLIANETEKWGKVVKFAGTQPE